MFRFLGFVCLVLGGAVGGAALSERLKQMRESCREIHSMLTQISILIRYRGLNVYEIVRELHISNSYKELSFLSNLPESYEPGADFRALWSEAIMADKSIGIDEQNLLLAFGSILGTSDIDGQLTSIESVIESVKIIEQKRCEEYLQKGKLYRSVGVLFGVMAGIMVI